MLVLVLLTNGGPNAQGGASAERVSRAASVQGGDENQFVLSSSGHGAIAGGNDGRRPLWRRLLRVPVSARRPCVAGFVAGEFEHALGLAATARNLGGGALQPGETLPGSLAQFADDFDRRDFHDGKVARIWNCVKFAGAGDGRRTEGLFPSQRPKERHGDHGGIDSDSVGSVQPLCSL